jgi:hypothetical protein
MKCSKSPDNDSFGRKRNNNNIAWRHQISKQILVMSWREASMTFWISLKYFFSSFQINIHFKLFYKYLKKKNIGEFFNHNKKQKVIKNLSILITFIQGNVTRIHAWHMALSTVFFMLLIWNVLFVVLGGWHSYKLEYRCFLFFVTCFC